MNSLNEVIERYRTDPYFDLIYDLGISSSGLDGETILHRSVIRGDIESIVILIDAGASVNAQDDDGNTPLHFAVSGASGEIVRQLIEAGASTSIRNIFGMNAIEWAKDSGYSEYISFLK